MTPSIPSESTRVAEPKVRALFVTPTWMATGETATALALAESIVSGGGDAWFLASTPAAQIVRPQFGESVQKLMARLSSHMFLRLIANAWRPIFERMCILLPCPLHEPGRVEGRQGHPYKSMAMPLRVDPGVRAQVRARYLGEGRRDEGTL